VSLRADISKTVEGVTELSWPCGCSRIVGGEHGKKVKYCCRPNALVDVDITRFERTEALTAPRTTDAAIHGADPAS
jgi:hypothetical protein